ncbi:ribosome maturation factor RimM [Chloroflexota bacterium]
MESSEAEFVTIGEILVPWGNKGKLKVRVLTDFPQRFAPSSMVYISRQPMTIDGTDWHKGKAAIKLKTIDSIEDAQKLQGQLVEICFSQVSPLPEGQYYHFQLIGLEVRTTEGELLGTVTEILTSNSNDNYVVRRAREEFLIPAIEDVVKSVDLNKGCIIIEPIEGLLGLNQKVANQL